MATIPLSSERCNKILIILEALFKQHITEEVSIYKESNVGKDQLVLEVADICIRRTISTENDIYRITAKKKSPTREVIETTILTLTIKKDAVY